MYDTFSQDYDRFVDWKGRLAGEMPFLEEQLAAADVRRVLDAACGTGMHAIALAGAGYQAVGTDFSPPMIERAKANAVVAGVEAAFHVAGFGEQHSTLGSGFDAVLCLGNSLPHVLTAGELDKTLRDFGDCLRPGGILVIQNRNFDAVLAEGSRWMEPQGHAEGDREWLFLRFYDFEPNGLLAFNVVTLTREAGGGWQQQINTTRLWPQQESDLIAALDRAGFSGVRRWGDLQESAFDARTSPNLVLVARKPSANQR
jgi:SAM-dependent methyltransferase